MTTKERNYGLKKKCEKLEKEIKLLKERLCTKTWKEVEINLDKDLLIVELKEQLKQKSNENNCQLKLIRDMQEKTKYLYLVNEFKNYNSKQLAIEELSILQACILGVSSYNDIYEYIERRIKELRGKK